MRADLFIAAVDAAMLGSYGRLKDCIQIAIDEEAERGGRKIYDALGRHLRNGGRSGISKRDKALAVTSNLVAEIRKAGTLQEARAIAKALGNVIDAVRNGVQGDIDSIVKLYDEMQGKK